MLLLPSVLLAHQTKADRTELTQAGSIGEEGISWGYDSIHTLVVGGDLKFSEALHICGGIMELYILADFRESYISSCGFLLLAIVFKTWI